MLPNHHRRRSPDFVFKSLSYISCFLAFLLLFGLSFGCDKKQADNKDPAVTSQGDLPLSSKFGKLAITRQTSHHSPTAQAPSYELYYILDAELLDDGSLLVMYLGLGEGNQNVLVLFDENQKVKWQIENQFNFPHTIDHKNNWVLISDSDNHRLALYDLDSERWTMIDLSIIEANIWPNDADFTADGNILFSDINRGRVFKINRQGDVLWSRKVAHGTTVPAGSEIDELHDPDELPNGNIIYCLSTSNLVVEVDDDNKVVWSYGKDLWYPKTVQRLKNGNTLIGDKNGVIEVTPAGKIVWAHANPAGDGMNYVRLDDGNTLIAGPYVGLIAPDHSIIWELPMPPMPPVDPEQADGDSRFHKILREVGYL